MIQIHQERCIGCGLCAKDCIAANIRMTEGKAHVLGECLACGHCVAICPQYAVSIPEFDMADKKSYVCMLLGYPAVQYKRTAPRKPADMIWR